MFLALCLSIVVHFLTTKTNLNYFHQNFMWTYFGHNIIYLLCLSLPKNVRLFSLKCRERNEIVVVNWGDV